MSFLRASENLGHLTTTTTTQGVDSPAEVLHGTTNEDHT